MVQRLLSPHCEASTQTGVGVGVGVGLGVGVGVGLGVGLGVGVGVDVADEGQTTISALAPPHPGGGLTHAGGVKYRGCDSEQPPVVSLT